MKLRVIGLSIFGWVFLLAVGSCSYLWDNDIQPGSQENPSVSLALRVGSIPQTKADVGAITEMGATPTFRGMTNLLLIPFASTSAIDGNDRPLAYISTLGNIGQSGLLSTSHAHLFNTHFSLPLNTASALVYGKAIRSGTADPESVESKQLNGSLIEVGFAPTFTKASKLGFRPEVMLSTATTPAAAQTIADVLTAIVVNTPPYSVTAYYGEGAAETSFTLNVHWEDVDDSNLLDCYRQMTSDGSLMPGSGSLVSALLTSLYTILADYHSINFYPYEYTKDGHTYDLKIEDENHIKVDLKKGVVYNGVCEKIKDAIEALAEGEGAVLSIAPDNTVSFTDPAVANYPDNLGLPSGAAVVRWTPTGYVVPLQNGVEGIAPISSYCYPPALYYYTNSTIKTFYKQLGQDDIATLYNDVNDWNTIKAGYNAGNSVTANTESVAIVEPLNYAVGMLSATVRAQSTLLQDNDGLDYTQVSMTGDTFPLTGVVIGRQYPLHFDFTPVYDPDQPDENQTQYYIYDSKFSGIYLKYTADKTTLPQLRTLVCETPAEKEVYFSLEFRNDSDKAFYGAEGKILPGHKFYLVGKLEVPEYNPDDPKTYFRSVFIQDHITSVNFVIPSLENAHSAVPDMGLPQLALGVQIESNWNLSYPETVILK